MSADKNFSEKKHTRNLLGICFLLFTTFSNTTAKSGK